MKKFELSSKKPQTSFMIGSSGRPKILSEELDQKLKPMTVNLRTAGAVINIHDVRSVLGVILRSNLERFGQFSDFEMTRSWVCSLYHHMDFSQRAAPKSRPIITWSLWEEINTQYLHDIALAVRRYNIPDELILNADQTPSKYVPTTNVTMAGQGTAHIPVRGADDIRAITVTTVQSLSCKMLPFQIIQTGKTERCLPKNVKGKENFLFSYNEKHWSNEVETLSLKEKIIASFTENVKRNYSFQMIKKPLLIWDAFKGQFTARVQEKLAELGLVVVMVPKNMTHLLQPLDVTTNDTIKKI